MTTFPIDFLLACLLISFGYYCCLAEGSSTVGVDVIALVLYQKNPQRNLAKIITFESLRLSVRLINLWRVCGFDGISL